MVSIMLTHTRDVSFCPSQYNRIIGSGIYRDFILQSLKSAQRHSTANVQCFYFPNQNPFRPFGKNEKPQNITDYDYLSRDNLIVQHVSLPRFPVQGVSLYSCLDTISDFELAATACSIICH